jgi:hypothetical protein
MLFSPFDMKITGSMAKFLVLGLIGGGIAFSANLLAFAMIEQINQKVSEDKQISLFWYGSRIGRQHRELYLNSKLAYQLNICTVCLVIWFLVSSWIIGH